MKKYKVICTQVSGIGKLLFNYGQECTEEQLINPLGLVKSKAIEEVVETKEEAKKRLASEQAEKEAKEKAEKEKAEKERQEC